MFPSLSSRSLSLPSHRHSFLSTVRPLVSTRLLSDQIPSFGILNERLLKSIETRTSHSVLNHAKRLLENAKELSELKRQSPEELRQDIEVEEKELSHEIETLYGAIAEDLSKDGDESIKTVLLEVKPGVGGQEAMLFAKELLSIYLKLCPNYGWDAEFVENIETDLGGLMKASIQVEGMYCYKMLRHEAGVHRVQRVPKTEKTGRIHTSTVTVTVLPIRELEQNREIPDKDLKITSIRSGGPGGQHVNKTESCVCILHIPTGVTVECQEGRSQVSNKEKALKKLKQLLWLREREKLSQEYERTKKNQVFSPDRSEKIRTYNFQQDRITDHRLGENLSNIKEFMVECDGILRLIENLEKRHKNKVLEDFMKNLEK